MTARFSHRITGLLLLILTIWIGSWRTAHSIEGLSPAEKRHHASAVCKAPGQHLSAFAGSHHPQPCKGKLPHKAHVHFHVAKLIMRQCGLRFSSRLQGFLKPQPGYAQAYPYRYFREITPPPPKAFC